MNELREQPGFYNTATTNCTTMVLINNRVNGAVSLLNWKILLSGYLPQLAYERGRLDQTYPVPELRRRSRINDAARAAGIEPPTSRHQIRDRASRFLRASRLPSLPPRVHEKAWCRRWGQQLPWKIDDLDTPAVLIDLDRVEANLRRAQDYCDAARPQLPPAHQDPQDPRARPPAGRARRGRHHLPEARRGRGHGRRRHSTTSCPSTFWAAPSCERLVALARRVRLSVTADNAVVARGLVAAIARGRAGAAGAGRMRHRRRALRRADARGGGRARAADRAAPGLRFGGLMTYPAAARPT